LRIYVFRRELRSHGTIIYFFLFLHRIYCFIASSVFENNKEAEKVEVKYEKLKKCYGHGSRTGPHQSEIRLLTRYALFLLLSKNDKHCRIVNRIKKNDISNTRNQKGDLIQDDGR
jgi:hypothetical protein